MHQDTSSPDTYARSIPLTSLLSLFSSTRSSRTYLFSSYTRASCTYSFTLFPTVSLLNSLLYLSSILSALTLLLVMRLLLLCSTTRLSFVIVIYFLLLPFSRPLLCIFLYILPLDVSPALSSLFVAYEIALAYVLVYVLCVTPPGCLWRVWKLAWESGVCLRDSHACLV